MNIYLKQFKLWYNKRPVREQALVIFLGWAIIYAIFSLYIFTPIHNREKIITTEINDYQNQINNWNIQLNAIKKIAKSPLYQQWLQQEKNFQSKREAYKSLLKTTGSAQWDDIIKTILFSETGITIDQIKNLPESPYNPPGLGQTTTNIYEQKLTLSFHSNYFTTLDYLEHLEKVLPTIHWDSFKYTVNKYPNANVEMEFSILYEKNE